MKDNIVCVIVMAFVLLLCTKITTDILVMFKPEPTPIHSTE